MLNAQPCPVVTPLNQTICSGGAITTISFGGVGSTWIRDNSTNVGGIEDASNGQVSSISGTLTNFTTTTQTVTFTITAPGCTAVTATVTVNPPPTLAPITGPSSVCDGATIDLNDATSGGSWSSNNTSIATVNSSGIVTGQSPGSVIITYTITSGSCSYSVVKSVDVRPSPTVTANATQTSICAGTSINLSATGSGTQPTTVSFSNTTQGGFQNATPLVPLFRCVTVSGLPVTQLSQLTNISVTINLTHQNDQEVEVYLVAPGGSIGNMNNGAFSMTTTPGESICLTHDHGGTGNNYTNTVFSSTGGTAIGSGAAPFTGTFSPDNSFATLNSGTNPNGDWCLWFVDDENTGQTGVFQNFTISFTYGTSTGTYTWTSSPSVPPFPFNGQNPGSVTPASTTTYTVSLTLSGCTTSDPVTVTVNPLPTISGANAVCVGQQITLTGSGTPSATPWASSNGAIATVNSSGVVTGVAAGSVNIIYTDDNGCQSAPKSITVNARPTAPTVGTITQPTCTVATGSVALSGLPASGTWTLTRNPGAVTTTGTGTTTTINGLAPGTYTFTVTNAAGCISVSSANVVINAQPATPATAQRLEPSPNRPVQ